MSARGVRWTGDPVPTLAGHGGDDKTRVHLDLENATLRPKPGHAIIALRRKFKLRGPHAGEAELPAYQVRDVVDLANYVTFALRHDLPTPDRRDTATLWDKWRRRVLDIRPQVVGAIAASPYPDPHAVHVVLDSIADDYALALRQPGELWRHYCPWAADFFTPFRLNPEAA